ncbi:YSIRK-type signal peptide-containing protein [Limosilactobacillus coleohominis]|uniref:YSIRK-type signal peptide-containing protein n=1 Tax=Limosilactobacillus coleohominis TaxID=181675 RepID=UPI0002E10090|nr:YSIRK-type signal peptide-containing protein [Limosilactobacillus coleohominis]
MVSKNNQIKYEKWNANRKPHYGLRKLSIGVASVLLGTTLYWGGTTVLADTNAPVTPPTQETEQTTTNTSDSENQKSSLNLTDVKSQSNAQPNSANQGSATNELGVSSAKAVDPNTLTESKAATADDSLATGMTVSDYYKALDDKNDYYNHSNEETKSLRIINRTVTMHKPSGDETITQSIRVRGVAGSSHELIENGPVGYNLMIGFIINNNGTRSTKMLFRDRVQAKAVNGKIVFDSEADKQGYEKFMSYDKNPDFLATLPAIDESQFNVPGYSYTISPANSNLGEWTFQPFQTNSVNIEVNYKKNANHTVTYKFVDQNGQEVGTATSVSGSAGSE